ncbi:hypothetical protein [Halocatena halophila]|uniref:hypothetical protein n=1 Tax=Halocatena halophila TaxID=2814576 RepID=UPI002ED20F1D
MSLPDSESSTERSVSGFVRAITTPRSLVFAYGIELVVFLTLLIGIYVAYSASLIGFTTSMLAIAALVLLELAADRFIVPHVGAKLESKTQ